MLSKIISALAICTFLTRSVLALDAKTVLDNYEAYVSSIHSISFHSTFCDRKAESEAFTNTLSEESKVDFVGKRKLRVFGKPHAVSPLRSQITDSRYTEQLSDSQQYIELGVISRNDTADGCFVNLKIPADYWQSNRAGLLYLAYPFGYVKSPEGYPTLLSVLRGDDVKSATVAEAGGSTVRLTTVTPLDEISLWLDPAKGWMPVQIECKRVAETTKADETTFLSYVVEKSSEHDGIWFPNLFRCHRETGAGMRKLREGMRVRKSPDGTNVFWMEHDKNAPGATEVEVPASSTFAEVTISDVEFNKTTDDDFRLHAEISDGLKVSIDGEVGGTHEWRGGKIVPVTPKP